MITKIKSLKTNNYFTNSSWLIMEQAIRFAVGFFVSIWVMRYLGPENFGTLSYVQSIASILAVFVTLGLNGIVLREITKHKDSSQIQILFSTSFLLSFTTSIVIILSIFILQNFILDESQKWVLLFILSFSFIFESIDILRVYFQEKILSKYVVFSGLISLFFGSILKVTLILNNYELIYFIIAIVIEKMIFAFCLIYFYRINNGRLDLSFDSEKAKYLLYNSWPLIISTLSYIVYTRTDQVMLEHYLGSHEVGIYTAAVRLYEIPFMLTTIVSSTFIPLLYQKYHENKEEFFNMTLKILSYTTLVAYIIVGFFLLFSNDLIALLYGEKYIESAKVLVVLSFVVIIQFNSYLRSGYLLLINKQKLFATLGILFAIVNILLNIILIKYYGLIGAVYSTLIVRIITLLIYYFFSFTKDYFYIQIKSLLLIGLKGRKKI